MSIGNLYILKKLPFRTLVIWSFKAEWLTKLIFTERWQGDKSLILGTSGYIYSYNYAGGYHLANQDYTNCIRTEQGMMLESLFDTTLIGLHCWTFFGMHHIIFTASDVCPQKMQICSTVHYKKYFSLCSHMNFSWSSVNDMRFE